MMAWRQWELRCRAARSPVRLLLAHGHAAWQVRRWRSGQCIRDSGAASLGVAVLGGGGR